MKPRDKLGPDLEAAKWKQHLKGKMAVMIWSAEGGVMVLHIYRNWTMDQITSYVDSQCGDNWYGQHAVAAETSEFGARNIGRPKRRFMRDAADKWIEVPAKPWSKAVIARHKKFLHDAIERAFREYARDDGTAVAVGGEPGASAGKSE